jgi:hypothetical protein
VLTARQVRATYRLRRNKQGWYADLAIGGSVARAIVGIVLPGLPLMILAFVGGLLVFIFRIIGKSAMRRVQYPNG